jgi:hypothetical protein
LAALDGLQNRESLWATRGGKKVTFDRKDQQLRSSSEAVALQNCSVLFFLDQIKREKGVW